MVKTTKIYQKKLKTKIRSINPEPMEGAVVIQDGLVREIGVEYFMELLNAGGTKAVTHDDKVESKKFKYKNPFSRKHNR